VRVGFDHKVQGGVERREPRVWVGNLLGPEDETRTGLAHSGGQRLVKMTSIISTRRMFKGKYWTH